MAAFFPFFTSRAIVAAVSTAFTGGEKYKNRNGNKNRFITNKHYRVEVNRKIH
jgi:hypothetical protein